MQTGGITGDVSAMRATPTGTAHDGLKRKVIPRHLHAARQKQQCGVGGGAGSDGSATAPKIPQQQKNSGGDQNDHNKVNAARRLIKKAANDAGSPDAPDSVTECIRLRPWIKSVLGDREIQLMRSAPLQKSVQKSVESERVAGSGGDSRESRQSDVGGVPSVAAQGAATECQGLVAAARGN